MKASFVEKHTKIFYAWTSEYLGSRELGWVMTGLKKGHELKQSRNGKALENLAYHPEEELLWYPTLRTLLFSCISISSLLVAFAVSCTFSAALLKLISFQTTCNRFCTDARRNVLKEGALSRELNLSPIMEILWTHPQAFLIFYLLAASPDRSSALKMRILQFAALNHLVWCHRASRMMYQQQ